MDRLSQLIPTKPLVLALGLLLLSFFPPLAIISLVGCVILWANQLPYTHGRSLSFRIVLGFVLTTCFMQVLAAAFWILHLPLHLPVVVMSLLLALGVMREFSIDKSEPLERRKIIDSKDTASFATTAICLAFLVFALVNAGTSLSTFVRFNTTSPDDITHLSLVLANYKQAGYMTPGVLDDTASQPDNSLTTYPQGWHFANSIWWHASGVNFNSDSPGTIKAIMVAFTATRLVWYGLVIYLICWFALSLSRARIKEVRPGLEFGVVLGVALFLQSTWLLQLLVSGFSSFLPQVAYSLVLAYFGREFLESHDRSQKAFLLIASLLISGMFLVWLLGAPLGFLTMLLLLIYKYPGLSYRQIISLLLSGGQRTYSILSGLILALGAVQIIITMRGAGASDINASGGIVAINSLMLAITLIGAIVFAYFARKKVQPALAIAVVVPPILAATAMYVYQSLILGSASYYSIKLMYLPFALMLPFAAAAIIIMAYKLTSSFRAVPALVITYSMLALLVICLQLPLAGAANYIRGLWYISPQVANGMVKVIVEPELTDDTNVVVASNIDGEDIVASMFMRAIDDPVDFGVTRESLLFHGPSACSIWDTDASVEKTATQKLDFDNFVACPAGLPYSIIAGDNYTELAERFKNSISIRIVR